MGIGLQPSPQGCTLGCHRVTPSELVTRTILQIVKRTVLPQCKQAKHVSSPSVPIHADGLEVRRTEVRRTPNF